MAYINQLEIDNFIAQAQRKIADLGVTIAEATEENLPFEDDMFLSYELSSLLKSLQDDWIDWDEIDVLRYIHYYNDKAQIIDPPFISSPKLVMQVLWPGGSGGSGGGIGEAPLNGLIYGRQSAAWVDLDNTYLRDAPSDGDRYARKDNAWISIEPYIITTASMTVTNGLTREVGANADVNFTAAINEGSNTVVSQLITAPSGFIWTTDPQAFVHAGQEASVRSSISYTAQVTDDVPTIDTDTDVVQYVFPIFSGSSASILTGAQIYTSLNKSIATIGNKNIAYNFTDEYAYFCFDADYNDGSIKILDGNGFDVTSAFTKFAITVDSGTFHNGNGGTDWTKSFDVYRTTSKTDINATYQFLNVTE